MIVLDDIIRELNSIEDTLLEISAIIDEGDIMNGGFYLGRAYNKVSDLKIRLLEESINPVKTEPPVPSEGLERARKELREAIEGGE